MNITPAEIVWPALLVLLLLTLQLTRTLIMVPHSSNPTDQVGHSIEHPGQDGHPHIVIAGPRPAVGTPSSPAGGVTKPAPSGGAPDGLARSDNGARQHDRTDQAVPAGWIVAAQRTAALLCYASTILDGA